MADIEETIRKIKTARLVFPSEDALRRLVEQLQEHASVLMQQDLGPDDGELNELCKGAEEHASTFRAVLDEGNRTQAPAWAHLLAIAIEALLRRWCQADTAGGRYKIRVEVDEHGGYYVWDTVSRVRTAERRGDGRRFVAHLPLARAWELTRRLNERAG